MPQQQGFNEAMQADVFYLKPSERKHAVLSIVDVGTKYMAACWVPEETSESYSKALEKVWIRHFGAPRILITDEGRPWLGGVFESWSSALGIDHQVAPGEAHERLALVERRHAVLRRACEVYMQDRKLTDHHGIKEALTYVIPQQNATPAVPGFSPSQWVLGYQPELAHLLDSNLNAAQLAGNNHSFEQNLERRTAAKMALTSADADSKLRRALSRKYQGQSRVFRLGERVWFWRDARQGALNKIRWLGPAHVVLREEDPEAQTEATKIKTYWLAYKSQLVGAAPHHVRGDILGPQHVLDDMQAATVRQLKSRGVTRYYDLRRANRQQLDDVEDDEQCEDPDGPLHDEQDEPPRQRLRLEITEGDGSPALQDGEYTPTSPAHSGYAPTSPMALPVPIPAEAADPLPAQVPVPDELPSPAATIRSRSRAPTIAEPSEEPTIPSGRQSPHTNVGEALIDEAPSTPAPIPRPTLDPDTAALYETVDAETFSQRRARFNRQGTLSFRPVRHQRPQGSQPYDPEPRPTTTTSPVEEHAPAANADPELPAAERAPEHALINHAFQVHELEAQGLPQGWIFQDGYFMLDKRPRDYWEVKSGCLIRHHLVPRRHKLCLHDLPKDAPYHQGQLDCIRVTVMYDRNGRSTQQTDDGTDTTPSDRSWTGLSIFQIKGDLRRELAMYAKAPLQGARHMGKMAKQQHAKNFKKDKNKSNLSERHDTRRTCTVQSCTS